MSDKAKYIEASLLKMIYLYGNFEPFLTVEMILWYKVLDYFFILGDNLLGLFIFNNVFCESTFTRIDSGAWDYS